MEPGAEIATGKWTAPECPYQIEYVARVLDDIRLAVVDAFFSLPRGGAEIGGILLGSYDGETISISDFEPLDCEHAMGPSFTLSARDQAKLAEMTAGAKRNLPDRQPVGWYHSHTRSEIFLSEADQALYDRFFPELWQIALVLKPHTFEPTRGGFFFRARDGSVHGTASYREFHLEPLPLRPNGNSSAAPRPAPEEVKSTRAGAAELPAAQVKDKRRVPITREIAIDAPRETPDGQTGVQEVPALDAPEFGQPAEGRSWRGLKAAAILAVGLAAGGAGYQTRQYWLPQVLTKARAVLPREPESYLSLAVADENGQLKIRWDANAPAVRNALDATLEITDGLTVPQAVRLDTTHLAAGGFTYGRQSERVDVTLIASEPGGQLVKEQTSFLGKLPAQKEAPASDGKDPDVEAARAEKLQKDLNFQAAKTRKLEKDLKEMREQLEKNGQAPDPTKKN